MLTIPYGPYGMTLGGSLGFLHGHQASRCDAESYGFTALGRAAEKGLSALCWRLLRDLAQDYLRNRG